MRGIVKFSFALVIMALLSLAGKAQVEKYLDKVVLKNGSVIWGLADVINDQVMVHISDSETVTVPLSQLQDLKTQRVNPQYYQRKVPGPYYQLNAGITLGRTHEDYTTETNFNGSLVAGYKFRRSLGVGIGTGLYYYPQIRAVPIFAELQGDMLNTRFTPSYFIRAGWGLTTDRNQDGQVEDTQGGFYLEPGLGLQWYTAGHSWMLRVSYLRQNSETVYLPLDFGNGNVVTNVETRTFERTTISLGFAF